MSEVIVGGRTDAVKTCSKCGETKPIERFGKSRRTRDGRDGQCRVCKRRAEDKYRKAHPDRVVASKRRWAERNPDNLRESAREYAKRKRQADPEGCRRYQQEWAKKNPAAAVAKTLRWKKAHPEKNAESVRRRKAKQRGATIGDLREVQSFYAFASRVDEIRCFWCGHPVAKGERHVDHIHPLDRGGAHATWNLCCACQHCNTRKGNKTPFDFCGQGFFNFGAPLIPQPITP